MTIDLSEEALADGARILPIHRFPVSLVYGVQLNSPRVIAVAAQRRRPGYRPGRR